MCGCLRCATLISTYSARSSRCILRIPATRTNSQPKQTLRDTLLHYARMEKPQRAAFALSAVPEKPSAASDALIVHPLSMFSSATSPTYGADWQLAAFLFQRQEMEMLRKQQQFQQQQSDRQRDLSLFDFTCDENLKAILGFLDGTSLCAARRVCRQLYELGDNDEYWYNLCIAEWAISPDQLRERPASYQALYKFACQSLQRMIREFFQEQCLASMQTSFRIPREAALTIARRSFMP